MPSVSAIPPAARQHMRCDRLRRRRDDERILKPTPVSVTTPMTMPTVAAAAPTAERVFGAGLEGFDEIGLPMRLTRANDAARTALQPARRRISPRSIRRIAG